MKDIEHAKHILKMAKKDFKALSGMKDDQVFEDEIFGFHAQQTVEKTIKALLSYNGINYKKIHDIDELLKLLGLNNVEIPDFLFDFGALTDFAVDYRYDSIESDEEPVDREKVTRKISELLVYVQEKIEQESNSF